MAVKLSTLSFVLNIATGPLDRGLNHASRSLNQFGLAFGRQRNIMFDVMGASYLQGAIGGMQNLLMEGVLYAGEIERAEIAFTTLLGSMSKARALMKDLISYANYAPITVRDVFNAGTSLLTGGFKEEQILPMVAKLSDLLSSAPGDPRMLMGNAIRSLTQIRVNRTFTGEESRELKNLGIPVKEALAKELKIAEEDVNKHIEMGKVSSEMLFRAIFNMADEPKFAGAALKQSKSLLGMWSTLADTVLLFGARLYEAFNVGFGMENSFAEIISLITNLPTTELGQELLQIFAFIGAEFREVFDEFTRYIRTPEFKNFIKDMVPVVKTLAIVLIQGGAALAKIMYEIVWTVAQLLKYMSSFTALLTVISTLIGGPLGGLVGFTIGTLVDHSGGGDKKGIFQNGSFLKDIQTIGFAAVFIMRNIALTIEVLFRNIGLLILDYILVPIAKLGYEVQMLFRNIALFVMDYVILPILQIPAGIYEAFLLFGRIADYVQAVFDKVIAKLRVFVFDNLTPTINKLLLGSSLSKEPPEVAAARATLAAPLPDILGKPPAEPEWLSRFRATTASMRFDEGADVRGFRSDTAAITDIFYKGVVDYVALGLRKLDRVFTMPKSLLSMLGGGPPKIGPLKFDDRPPLVTVAPSPPAALIGSEEANKAIAAFEQEGQASLIALAEQQLAIMRSVAEATSKTAAALTGMVRPAILGM